METEERVEPVELDESGSLHKPDPPEPVALIIKVTSWATLVIGLIMLGVGLLAGYTLRPFVETQGPQEVAENTTVSATPSTPNNPIVNPPEDEAARQRALMETVIAQTRHFKGNPNAPVTLIEFSDFQ